MERSNGSGECILASGLEYESEYPQERTGLGAASVPANGAAKEVAAGMAKPLRETSIRAATEGAGQLHGIPHCGQSISEF